MKKQMKDILKHFDIVTETDAQIKNLAHELDSLADSMDDETSGPESKIKKPQRDNMDVYGRKRQR